jgi:hypothetical protein
MSRTTATRKRLRDAHMTLAQAHDRCAALHDLPPTNASKEVAIPTLKSVASSRSRIAKWQISRRAALLSWAALHDPGRFTQPDVLSDSA